MVTGGSGVVVVVVGGHFGLFGLQDSGAAAAADTNTADSRSIANRAMADRFMANFPFPKIVLGSSFLWLGPRAVPDSRRVDSHRVASESDHDVLPVEELDTKRLCRWKGPVKSRLFVIDLVPGKAGVR